MAIEIRRDALEAIFTADAVLYVEEGLEDLLPEGAAQAFTVVPFSGLTIGREGPATRAAEVGLSAAPGLVIEREPGRFGRELADESRGLGLAPLPDVLTLSRLDLIVRSVARGRIAWAILRQWRMADLSAAARRREVELQTLRDRVADLQRRLQRQSDVLALAGFTNAEFNLTLGASQLSKDDNERAPSLSVPLGGVASLEVRTGPADFGRLNVSFSQDGRIVSSSVVEIGPASGELSVIVPTDVLIAQDIVDVSLQALTPATTAIGSGAIGSVRFRMLPPAHGASPSPPSVTESLPVHYAAQGGSAYFVSELAEDNHHKVQGIVMGPGSSFAIKGRLQAVTSRAPAPDVRLIVSRHGDAPDSGQFNGQVSVENVDGLLSLNASVSDRGRYDIHILSAKTEEPRARKTERPRNRVLWGRPTLRHNDVDQPLAFASAKFASLTSVLSFADGPLEELTINSTEGFAVVAASEGAGYLQTHPVAGRVAGARLSGVIPYGATKIWIDIENAHAQAAPVEFLAIIAEAPYPKPVREWLEMMPLPSYDGFSVLERDDGSIVARTILAPATATVMRIELLQALRFTGTLYCLVRPLTDSLAYGWCRWHRLVVGLPLGQSLSR